MIESKAGLQHTGILTVVVVIRVLLIEDGLFVILLQARRQKRAAGNSKNCAVGGYVAEF